MFLVIRTGYEKPHVTVEELNEHGWKIGTFRSRYDTLIVPRSIARWLDNGYMDSLFSHVNVVEEAV